VVPEKISEISVNQNTLLAMVAMLNFKYSFTAMHFQRLKCEKLTDNDDEGHKEMTIAQKKYCQYYLSQSHRWYYDWHVHMRALVDRQALL
jgi:aspartyl/asparaginyl-tRNA synthetase